MGRTGAMPFARLAKPGTAAALACFVLLILVGLRSINLHFTHPLNSLDGAMQTLFALDAFANGRQLGEEFQSYLGVTLILFLLPGYLIAGSTLFAASLSATAGVLFGLAATVHGILRLFHGLQSGTRLFVAVALVCALHTTYLGIPGNSLRPLRWALPFLLLPFVYPILVQISRHKARSAVFALGLMGGVGLVWSNDAGIPTLASMAAALLLVRSSLSVCAIVDLGIFFSGAFLSAALIIMVATHGAPGGWFYYNFVALPSDQIWYFAPWTRDSRVLEIADIGNIFAAMTLTNLVAFVLLSGSLSIMTVRCLHGKCAPARTASFVFVGLAVIGTGLLPQIGGMIKNAYNGGMVLLGFASPFIVFQRELLALVRQVPRAFRIHPGHVVAASLVTVVLFVGSASLSVVRTMWDNRDAVFVAELGVRVPPKYAADMRGLLHLRTLLDAQAISDDARILSTYTSYTNILLGGHPASAYGALIHALGPSARQAFTDVVADHRVQFVTTVSPDFSGWANWNLRAQWPFFEALFLNYEPVASDFQHILWQRRESPRVPFQVGAAFCQASSSRPHAELVVWATTAGLVAIDIALVDPSLKGRRSILTAVEDSPLTRVPNAIWSSGPRYGLRLSSDIAAVVPVEAEMPSTITLEVLDAKPLQVATCSARFIARPDLTELPSFHAFARNFPDQDL